MEAEYGAYGREIRREVDGETFNIYLKRYMNGNCRNTHGHDIKINAIIFLLGVLVGAGTFYLFLDLLEMNDRLVNIENSLGGITICLD